MKKTSLYIDPDVDRALGHRAEEQGISKAELIRRVLAEAAKPKRRPRLSGRGSFHGPPDLAQNLEEYLERDGFGES